MDEGLMKTYGRAEEVFVDGHGARLITSDGREFLDFLAGIAVSALGHGHRRLADELRDQVGRVVHLSNLFRHPYTIRTPSRWRRGCAASRAWRRRSSPTRAPRRWSAR